MALWRGGKDPVKEGGEDGCVVDLEEQHCGAGWGLLSGGTAGEEICKEEDVCCCAAKDGECIDRHCWEARCGVGEEGPSCTAGEGNGERKEEKGYYKRGGGWAEEQER